MLNIQETVQFHSQIFKLVDYYKKANRIEEEAMDGDQVEALAKHIEIVINLYQGNITFNEYLDLTNKLEEWSEVGTLIFIHN